MLQFNWWIIMFSIILTICTEKTLLCGEKNNVFNWKTMILCVGPLLLRRNNLVINERFYFHLANFLWYKKGPKHQTNNRHYENTTCAAKTNWQLSNLIYNHPSHEIFLTFIRCDIAIALCLITKVIENRKKIYIYMDIKRIIKR